jgi:MurNAc alpha-1-phosphate uridylyltransferase
LTGEDAPVAMILAAGRGERMRPLTDRMPKPMLAAGGKPLIVHLIEALATAGCRHLVINTAHLGEVLESALGDGARWDVHVTWSREGTALETAGGIALARPLLGEKPFLVVNGDIWTDAGFAPFIAHAQRALADPSIDAHLLLVDNPQHHPDGDFLLHQGRVVEAAPEPAMPGGGPAPVRLTFAGIGLYRPRLFDRVVAGSRAALAPLLFEARARGALSGERLEGQWFDIGTPARLAALDEQLRAAR